MHLPIGPLRLSFLSYQSSLVLLAEQFSARYASTIYASARFAFVSTFLFSTKLERIGMTPRCGDRPCGFRSLLPNTIQTEQPIVLSASLSSL
jgi:hypothetical protein